MELLSRAVVVALVALLAMDFFLSDQFSKQLWLLLALCPALLAIAAEQAGTGRVRGAPAGRGARRRSRRAPNASAPQELGHATRSRRSAVVAATYEWPASISRPRRPGSEAIASSSAPRPPRSPGGTSRAASPTASRMPPTSVATTGTPAANASTRTWGRPSVHEV